MGILVAGVAHEINNPIAFIHGNLSSLKKYSSRVRELLVKYEAIEQYVNSATEGDISDLMGDVARFKKEKKIEFILGDMIDLAEESLEGVERVRNTIKDLKTFSRVDLTERDRVDINAILESALNIIWSEIKYKAEVIKDYGELPEVMCFSQKISQVFMNILMNAVQAIEERGTITISTRHIKEGRRADDSSVEILISDTGGGIPEESILKIFDPFFTTKPVGQGTGLGLSITYDIVRSHGGNITVESKAGKGTTFSILLPLDPRL